MPGIDGVLAAPDATPVFVVLLVVGAFAALVLVGTSMRREWRRAAVSALVVAGCVAVAVVHLGPRLADARRVYDVEATWRALEERYGVTLAQSDKDALDLGRVGSPSGGRLGGVVDQRPLAGVVDATGAVREGLFLQFRSSFPVRLAVVTRPAGTNELVATTGTWWPELAVVDDARG